ncbi:MAG: rhodanese-like domain-containing protein [Saprospiraceae bacterium]|nr:rhodanese-like domain-containing protein [Saprospiraceae bacterium]
MLVAGAQVSAVSSTPFGLMLDKLLKHSVSETSVSRCKNFGTNTVFLDARESNEFAISHIENALNIGFDHFSLQNVKKIPKNAHIIVYCSVGYRSEKIAEQLIKNGFSNVENLVGGIFEWSNQGLPLYDAKGKTNSVHTYNSVWSIWLKKGQKVY